VILEHYCAETSYFWLGDPIKAREHADRVLALYSDERHGHLVGILNNDPKTVSLIYAALSTWMLGYPEQAVHIIEAAHDHARRRAHPFDLGWALSFGAQLFDFLREPDELLRRVEEADRVGRENRLPFVTEQLVPIRTGIASIRKGQVAEGMVLLERGIARLEKSGGRINSPMRNPRWPRAWPKPAISLERCICSTR
jgi:hypothetical protein